MAKLHALKPIIFTSLGLGSKLCSDIFVALSSCSMIVSFLFIPGSVDLEPSLHCSGVGCSWEYYLKFTHSAVSFGTDISF